MANTKSALKRVRQTKTRTEQNRIMKTRVKNTRKAADAALAEGDVEKVKATVKALISATDRAVKRGAVHPNYSSRMKSRYSARAAAV